MSNDSTERNDEMNLEIKGKDFYQNGKKITVISGAIHYFRIHQDQYKDRLLKLKACGFNAVETYVAWNLHEPRKGEFVFEDFHNLERFIQIAAELELMVFFRPGPYICSEWELGGFPSWLIKDKNMKLRCYNGPYLQHVDDWFDVLIPKIVPYLASNGGPIVAVQVENEYGSYGDDQRYLEYIKDGLIKRKVDVLLFTSDGPTDHMLTGGSVPGVFKTANFGSRTNESFDKLEAHQPDKPLMCMEFWNGWFDHWGTDHHVRDPQDVADVFEDMLKRDGHVNFYMFHGGTNFGFMNGANFKEEDGKIVYLPTVTSYDYDSVLTEAGDITDKYRLIRSLIEKYVGKIDLEIPANSVKKAYGKVALTQSADLFSNIEKLAGPVESVCAETMEVYGQNYGYILYSNYISGPREALPLTILDVRDRAHIFVDGQKKGIYTRNGDQDLSLAVPKEGVRLDVLVENQGRINYGHQLKDYKGITEGICLQWQFLYNYQVYNLEMDNIEVLDYQKAEISQNPTFYKGELIIDEVADTFIKLEHFTKGIVFINGFNLGRYWEIGPTQTLYVPGPLLKKGSNEIVVFEEEGTRDLTVEFINYPILGGVHDEKDTR